MTGGVSGVNCSPEELRSLFLFEKLTFDQLAWLCRVGRVEAFQPGPVYAEGEPATCFYVMIEGTVVLSRRVGPDDIEVNRRTLSGQLASLEIETEAQVLHRHDDLTPRHADFDPLELDRYSTLQQFSRALAETSSDVASIGHASP